MPIAQGADALLALEGADRRRDADAHGSGQEIVPLAGAAERVLGRCEGAATVLEQGAACLRQADVVGRALE